MTAAVAVIADPVNRIRGAAQTTARPAKVCFSFGMGVDSATIIHEWVNHPATRDFDWDECVAVTAMTGDEYPATERAMNEVILPLFRRVGLRYVQIARAGQRLAAGYEVLADSTRPRRMHMRGTHWRLSDELHAAATVPQVAHGQRRCSARAKGEPLDAWMADEIAAGRLEPNFRHIIGFAADEQGRALRDSTYGTNSRRAEYPLITWDYDREACEAILEDAYGFRYPRSCCVYCPFQCSKRDRDALVERWREQPAAGAHALRIERDALVLNPRMALFGETTAHDVVTSEGLTEVTRLTSEHYDSLPAWSVYEVRRAFAPSKNDPARKGTPWRSVRSVMTGTRAEASTTLRELAAAHNSWVWTGGGLDIERVWLRHLPEPRTYPATEHFFAIGASGAEEKERTNFEDKWIQFTRDTAGRR